MNIRTIQLGSCLLWLLLLCQSAVADHIIHHELEVRLQPAEGVLEVKDSITLPKAVSSFDFSLHHNLQPEMDAGYRLDTLGHSADEAPVPITRYRARFDLPRQRFSLSYRGVIRHSLEQISRDYGGDLTQTPGIIDPEGVFLSLASRWFPLGDGERFTFSLTTHLPEGWRSVSQGEILLANGWREDAPQDDIYLVAAPYTVYQEEKRGITAMVFLRQPDNELARRYLESTHHYLELYSRLLGDYPYCKFALVENFWETGYGMPSFTLLGPTVIRLPFIIHTSYPHEILHNWWGNGVYVSYHTGNWSEGLTSYLADHLLREQRGGGAEYRRTTLQRYTDFIAEAEDFPLTAFRSRHGQASQAIGYGKTLMFLHMLRRELGDATFRQALQRFYQDNLHQVAGFPELQKAFEAASDRELDTEFDQWTQRTGAPDLGVGQVEVRQTSSGFTLEAELIQRQSAPAFALEVPVAVQVEGEELAQWHRLSMKEKRAVLKLDLPARPLRLKVDPRFDLFRRLDPSEIPSSLGQLFGAEEVLVVLPRGASAEMRDAYRTLAEGWAARAPGLEIVWDDGLESLPTGRVVWLFGAENKWLEDMLGGIKDSAFSREQEGFTLEGDRFGQDENSLVLTAHNPADPQQTIGWVAAHSPDAIPLLGRKLPHYMKYSYLVFTGGQVVNIAKGQWPLADSALSVTLPGGEAIPDASLPIRPALSALLEP